MGTAASDVPLEFGADPGVVGCLGAAGDVSVAAQQMFFKETFTQNHLEASLRALERISEAD